MANEQKRSKRILVLCVDRDDDLGQKTGIKTPVVGKEDNLNAAVSLALKDPEEADANSMFEAIRVYEQLQENSQSGESFYIATVSGSHLGVIKADRKIVKELNDLLFSTNANEVILVTDGYSDEAVMPLIESRVPVSAVKRVVVKHSESIEETAALFSRYLKTLTQNPRYARIVLGLPGLLILILGILLIFNLLELFGTVFLFVIGGFMLFKGFGVDKTFKNLVQTLKDYSPPPIATQISNFSAIAGVLSILVGIYLGVTNAMGHIGEFLDIPSLLGVLPKSLGYFLQGSINLAILGVSVILFGRAIRMYIEHDVRLLRNVALIALIAWTRQILFDTAEILIFPNTTIDKLIFSIIIGILIAVASLLILYTIYRAFRNYFVQTKSDVPDLEN